MKNKVIFFAGKLESGGAERTISLLSRSFAEKGYSVEIVLFRSKVIFYELSPLVRVVLVPERANSQNPLRKLIWLRGYLKAQRGLILSFMAPFNMIVLFATLFTKVKIVAADSNDPRKIPANLFFRFIRNLLYLRAKVVILQTERNRAYFSRFLGRRAVIIPNYIDVGEAAGLSLRTAKKKKIVSVGRLKAQKNQRLMIDAFSIVLREFPDYELYIYGEGEERPALEEFILKKGLKGKIHLPGEEKDIITAISDAELFVQSSNFEGMSNALMEAMCVGLPVVSTDVSGARDLIKNGCGLIVPIGDRQKLADAMCYYLRDPDIRNNSGKKSMNSVLKYSTDQVLNRWERLVNQHLLGSFYAKRNGCR